MLVGVSFVPNQVPRLTPRVPRNRAYADDYAGDCGQVLTILDMGTTQQVVVGMFLTFAFFSAHVKCTFTAATRVLTVFAAAAD